MAQGVVVYLADTSMETKHIQRQEPCALFHQRTCSSSAGKYQVAIIRHGSYPFPIVVENMKTNFIAAIKKIGTWLKTEVEKQ